MTYGLTDVSPYACRFGWLYGWLAVLPSQVRYRGMAQHPRLLPNPERVSSSGGRRCGKAVRPVLLYGCPYGCRAVQSQRTEIHIFLTLHNSAEYSPRLGSSAYCGTAVRRYIRWDPVNRSDFYREKKDGEMRCPLEGDMTYGLTDVFPYACTVGWQYSWPAILASLIRDRAMGHIRLPNRASFSRYPSPS
jgi:hypothetical protein